MREADAAASSLQVEYPQSLAENYAMDFALNAFGFVLLIVVFVLFRGWVRGRRRRAYEQFNRVMNPPAVPAVCRQCGTPVAAGAAFCPRWVAALPPPLPGMVAGAESGRKTLMYLV